MYKKGDNKMAVVGSSHAISKCSFAIILIPQNKTLTEDRVVFQRRKQSRATNICF